MEKTCMAWFSIKYIDGSAVRKVFARSEDTQLAGEFVVQGYVGEMRHLVKIEGFKTDPDEANSRQSENAMQIPNDMPMHTVAAFGVRYLVVYYENNAKAVPEPTKRNAFDVLRDVNRVYDWLPPPKRTPSNNKDKLYNDVLQKCMDTFQVGFRRQQQDIGSKIINTLVETLWFIDPFLDKMKERSCKIPDELYFCGYRDLKKCHKKYVGVQMKEPELKASLDALAEVLMYPWWTNPRFQVFYKCVNGLYKALEKYHKFLANQQERTNQNHASPTPVRSLNDNWSLKSIEGNPGQSVPTDCKSLISKLETLDTYEAVPLDNFEPSEVSDRRKWRMKIESVLPFPVSLFSISFGNYIGNSLFLWKIPCANERSAEKELEVVTHIKDKMPVFSTRAIRKEFFERYPNLKPYELRNMFFKLTNFEYCAENQTTAAVDERFLKFILSSDDEDLIVDLRKNNGRPCDPKLQPFWDELAKLLEEVSTVDDRRQHSTSYLPFAISIDDLREQVKARLPPGDPTPSNSWIRLNFMPSNPMAKTAANYTGRFNVKYAVQQRLLRAQHDDASFALHQFYMLKDMAVQYREFAHMQCLDDKAIVPIGEPYRPVSTGVRAHHQGLTISNSKGLLCLDHDYSIAGMVPSVCFQVSIPENSRDSFHSGTLHITLKDKVFQSSTPFRHGMETINILREFHSHDDVNLDKPILFRYTDGGPDHRTTFRSVQVAALLEFISLDLDLLVCVRTAPNQSYNNPAERMMSILNIALQNTALCRTAMSEGRELQAKRLTSLASIRRYAEKNPDFKTDYIDSIQEPITIISERFQKLKLKGKPAHVHSAATDGEIKDLLEIIHVLDQDYKTEDISNFEKSRMVHAFMKSHARFRQYSFQPKFATMLSAMTVEKDGLCILLQN
ncbi:uncharacterized protein LOC130048586 [Ostrea edulis]|uniref:uncharacterized protein LOC130046312 n=1 Tax=Ostrea edulis TaxID=37623 RepID=UPI002096330F|nr:uncharacterized protein LOC130046312 [Ostrea edulis]XP_056000879.1 uncharacterized protein LOC130048314 [Ostrea edulis]XP_056001474.1 uncharacterized protein LOC130048586 [Ostrea edulis]